MLSEGEAYPLFYDTLFYDLRNALAEAAATAQANRLGLWSSDVTLTGVDASSVATLEAKGVIFPKLFRRLTEFFVEKGKLVNFRKWVEAKKEPVLDLDTANFTHLENFIQVADDVVSMTKAPVRLVFTSAKGKAAWV